MVKKTILDYFSEKSSQTKQESNSSSFENFVSENNTNECLSADLSSVRDIPKKACLINDESEDSTEFSLTSSREMQLNSENKMTEENKKDLKPIKPENVDIKESIIKKSKPENIFKNDQNNKKIKAVSEPKIKQPEVDNTVDYSIIKDFLDTDTFCCDTSTATSTVLEDPSSAHVDDSERYTFLIDIRDQNNIPKGEEGYDPSTLFIPEHYYKKFTPFEKQFWDIKKKYFDTIIFFKKGKFYELYEDDALIASKLFDFKITDRVNMKMAGFPESTYDVWAAKFLEAGYKIGRVDQKENSIGKKIREQNGKKDKIIERELQEVITVGTVYNNEYIVNPLPFYLGVIVENNRCHKNQRFSESNTNFNGKVQPDLLKNTDQFPCKNSHHFSILLYDASINKMFRKTFCDSSDLCSLKTIFVQNDIKELISSFNIKNFYFPNKISPIKDQIASQRKYDFAIEGEFTCYSYLYNYMKTLKRELMLESAEILELNSEDTFMSLDGSTIKNLDILSNNNDNTADFSLFKTINHCSTPFGQRMLKRWLLAPLMNREKIEERRKFSSNFESKDLYQTIEKLKEIGDIERLYGKLKNSNQSLKDLLTFIKSLKSCKSFLQFLNEDVKDEILLGFITEYIQEVSRIISGFENLYEIFEDRIEPKNDSDELFVVRKVFHEIESNLMNYLEMLKRDLCSNNLTFKSIGKEIFQVEAPNSLQMPDGFFLVSSTKTHKRYYSPELKKMISDYQEYEERIFQSQGSIIRRAVGYFYSFSDIINRMVAFIASIDCYVSFNIFANIYDCSVPKFSDQLKIINFGNPIYPEYIKNSFEPVNRISLVTGPNMGGKSTFLRSVCMNIILAQMGMKVLCEYMSLPVFDKIFTRIGASDSLARGESTFMIEMNETSKILNTCTNKSFVIMDELGRGTSTEDGSAIAMAVLEYLKKIGCYMLFSTHYHNLVKECSGVDKLHVKCKIDSGDIVFLYKIAEGICEDSYGLYVAKMAGIPENIIQKAIENKKKILEQS